MRELQLIPRKGRRGLTLIEVIIAMGILVGTTAVLVQLIRIGERQANRAVDMTEAQTLCHNKIAELMAGLGSITPVENEPTAIDSPWSYTVQIEPLGFRELYSITVIVSKPQTSLAPTTGGPLSNPGAFHLTRWVNASELPAGIQLDFDTPTQAGESNTTTQTSASSFLDPNSE